MCTPKLVHERNSWHMYGSKVIRVSQSLYLTTISIVFEQSFVLSPVLFNLHFYLHRFFCWFKFQNDILEKRTLVIARLGKFIPQGKLSSAGNLLYLAVLLLLVPSMLFLPNIVANGFSC